MSQSKDKAYTVHVLSGTHWDREWRYTAEQSKLRLSALMDNLLDLLEDFRGGYEETRLLARGVDVVEKFYYNKMKEYGYDPDKKIPDVGVCMACGSLDHTPLHLNHPPERKGQWQEIINP